MLPLANGKTQTPTSADEMVQRPIHECESARIPNPDNENGETSVLDKERSQSLTPGNEREQEHIPILENNRDQIPNPPLDNLNTSLEASVITGERAGLAVKAVDTNSLMDINTVQQESSSSYEATSVNNPSTKPTFSCEICSKVIIC